MKALAVASDGQTIAAAGGAPGKKAGWLRTWYADPVPAAGTRR